MKLKTKHRPIQRKVLIGIVYPLLVVAALCTMVPLLWLFSSSFKNADEIFAVPIRWLPKLPPRISSSPYIVSNAYPKIRKPKSVHKDIWKTLQPELENVIREKVHQHIETKPLFVYSNITHDLQNEMTKGIWKQTVTTLPIEVWTESSESVVSQVEKMIIPETLDTIWNNVYRQIAIETFEIEDNEFNRYKMDNIKWVSTTDTIQQVQESTGATPITYLKNDFQDGNDAIFTTSVESPIPIFRIRRIILPVRGNASYQ